MCSQQILTYKQLTFLGTLPTNHSHGWLKIQTRYTPWQWPAVTLILRHFNFISPFTYSMLLMVPHPVKSTTSLSPPLTLVPATLELAAVYPAQCLAGCYLLYLILADWNLQLSTHWRNILIVALPWMFHLRWAVVTLSGASCSKVACHTASKCIYALLIFMQVACM